MIINYDKRQQLFDLARKEILLNISCFKAGGGFQWDCFSVFSVNNIRMCWMFRNFLLVAGNLLVSQSI